MKCMVIITLLCTSLSCFATINDVINRYRIDEKQIITNETASVKGAQHYSSKELTHGLPFIQHLMQQGQTARTLQTGAKAADGALLFVSFSMPKALLVQMMCQAASFHIPVIIRGLIKNSLPKTLTAMLNLTRQAKKQHGLFHGVGIDPVWFRQFAITRVPALVVTKRLQTCGYEHVCIGQPFDVVYGNQSVHDALVQIARDGSPVIRPIAAKWLHVAKES